jgi:hypothetical protein
MSAAWLYGRSFLRGRWALFLALGLFGGIASGVVLATWGGARRTHSAIDRFDLTTHAPHIVGPIGTSDQAAVWPRIAALPEVEIAARLTGRAVMSKQDFAAGTFTFWGVDDDNALGNDIGAPLLLRGRRVNNAAPDEVALPESVAKRWHLDVGDAVPLMSWINGKFLGDVESDEYVANGPTIELNIVGITRNIDDVDGETAIVIPLSPAFAGAHPTVDLFGQLGFYRLRGGLDAAEAFIGDAQAIVTPSDNPDDETSFQLIDLRGNIGDALDTAERGELGFAAVGGVATMVMMVIAIGRTVRHGDDDALSSIGMSRHSMVAATLVPLLPAAAVAFVVACAVAYIGSRTSMVTLAQHADPALGARFDGWLWIGAAAFAVSLLAIAGAAAAVRRNRRAARRQTIVHIPLGRAWQVLGSSLIRTGHRGRAGATRAATVGAAVAFVGLSAGVIYVRSLDALSRDRVRWGLDADFTADVIDPASSALPVIDRHLVDAASVLHYGFTFIEGEPVHTVAFEPLAGSIEPEVLKGRAPAKRGEIALGSAFFDRGASIGSTISVASEQGLPVDMLVVGEVVAPPLDGRGTLASSAIVTTDTFSTSRVDQTSTTTAIRNLPGRTSAETVASLGIDVHNVFTVLRPAAISNLAAIRNVAERLVALLAFLGLAGALIAMAGALRLGRRDVAIGLALGMTRASIRGALTTFVGVIIARGALVASIGGGLAGVALWRAQSDSLGVRVVPVVPWTLLVTSLVIGVLGATLVGALIGDRYGRARWSDELRAE